MILTCPNCASRFLLPAQALAPSGRRVKCSSCSSKWFQLPDPDEMLADMEAKIRDIPEAVKPERPPAAIHPPAEKRRRIAKVIKIPYLSYGAAALVFLAILTAFVVLKPVIMRIWPPAAVLYEMMGLPVEIPGEGVTFDKVSAKVVDEKTILIEGQIINLTLKKQKLPAIEAVLEEGSGDPLAQWIFAPPAPAAGPEAILPFKARYEGDTQKAERLQLRFIFGSKTASEGGGNTPTPPADVPVHPPGDEVH